MHWTAAIALYLGLSLATFNRNLDPKEGTYVDKYTQTVVTAGKEGKSGTEIYGAIGDDPTKINPSLPADTR